jgi:hypothetical protein
MPATTPNLGFPYPLDADPIQTADDIQLLAEAVDSRSQAKGATFRTGSQLAAAGVTHAVIWQVQINTPDTLDWSFDANRAIVAPDEEGVYVITLRVAFSSPLSGGCLLSLNIDGVQWPAGIASTNQAQQTTIAVGLGPGVHVYSQIYNGGSAVEYAADFILQKVRL